MDHCDLTCVVSGVSQQTFQDQVCNVMMSTYIALYSIVFMSPKNILKETPETKLKIV